MKPMHLLFVLLPLVFSCHRDIYQTGAYRDLAPTHHTVAVLPVTTLTNGRIPTDLTPAMLDEIENNESQAFQIALFDQISRQTGRYQEGVRIGIQHYTETNSRLAAAGINLRDSWDMSPTELAKILGVDAVVRATVRKQWYLTNLESFGLHVARSVMLVFSNGPWWLIPNDRTSDVVASCAVIDGPSGTVIWNTENTKSTDWNTPHSVIVRRIARTLARRFPYRY